MFQRIKEILDKGQRFLVAAHIDPDGDALGSAFSLALALSGLGKEAVVYLKDKVPYRYQFLPLPLTLVHEIPEVEGFDAIFVVDCGDLFRVGEGYEKLKKGYLVCIDHHHTNEAFGQLNIIDERASSTAELIYMVLKALNATFNLEIAVNIYTGVLTDTGSFRYDSTTKRAFSICEEMMGFGVVPAQVAQAVYENHPKERFLLLSMVLAGLQFYCSDRVALVYVTEEMFNKTNTNREFSDGFVEEIKEMRGLEVACLLRELGPTKYKASMRSKGDVDVALVARTFGGGGHKKAAGCVIEGSMEEAKKKLIEAIGL